MPDAIAQQRTVRVRGILPPGEAALGEIVQHFGARDAQKRPHEISREGAHRRQAGRASAAQQSQQNRLCLIVARVPDGDGAGHLPRAHRSQKPVALLASRGLDALTPQASAPAHIRVRGLEGHPEPRAKLRTEGRVLGRVGTQAMIEMARHDPEPTHAS